MTKRPPPPQPPRDMDTEHAAVRASQARVTEAMIAHLSSLQSAETTADIRAALGRLQHDLARLYNSASVQATLWVFERDARAVPALQNAVAETQQRVAGIPTILNHIEAQQRRTIDWLTALDRRVQRIEAALEFKDP